MAEPLPEPPAAWTPGRVALATLVVAAVTACFALLLFFRVVIFCGFVGIALATALKRPIAWLEQRGLQHSPAVFAVFGTLVLLLVVGIGLGLPPLSQQVSGLQEELPKIYGDAREHLLHSSSAVARRFATHLSEKPPWLTADEPSAKAGAEGGSAQWSVLGNVGVGLLACVAVLLLAFYWSLQEERTLRALLMIAPAPRRGPARELINAVQAKVGAFVYGQSILCLLIGLLTFAAYSLIGLPHAAPLALATGLLEAVPVFGLFLGAGLAGIVAISVGPAKLVGVIAATAVIHLIDNLFLSPRVVGRAVGVHPVVTLLSMVGFGALFGLPGAILAVPLAAILQLIIDRLVLSREAMVSAALPGRDHLSVLRHEVGELLQDVRINVREKDEASTRGQDQLEEEIELIARDLDQLLAAQATELDADPFEAEARI